MKCSIVNTRAIFPNGVFPDGILPNGILPNGILPKAAFLACLLLMMMSGTAFSNDCYTINGENLEENTNTRPFICFDHDEHNEIAGLEDCSQCHHVYEDGELMAEESSEDSSCAECHYNETQPNELDLIVRYHKLCRDCHLSEKKGPVTCGGCHLKP